MGEWWMGSDESSLRTSATRNRQSIPPILPFTPSPILESLSAPCLDGNVWAPFPLLLPAGLRKNGLSAPFILSHDGKARWNAIRGECSPRSMPPLGRWPSSCVTSPCPTIRIRHALLLPLLRMDRSSMARLNTACRSNMVPLNHTEALRPQRLPAPLMLRRASRCRRQCRTPLPAS